MMLVARPTPVALDPRVDPFGRPGESRLPPGVISRDPTSAPGPGQGSISAK